MNLGGELSLNNKIKILNPDPRKALEIDTLESIKPFTTHDKNMIVISNYPEIKKRENIPVIYFLDHNSYLSQYSTKCSPSQNMLVLEYYFNLHKINNLSQEEAELMNKGIKELFQITWDPWYPTILI